MVTRRLHIATHSATEPNLCREMVAERISFLMAVAGMMKVMNLYLDTLSSNPAPHSTQLSCRIQYKLGDMGFRGHGTESIHTFRVRHGDMGFRGTWGHQPYFARYRLLEPWPTLRKGHYRQQTALSLIHQCG